VRLRLSAAVGALAVLIGLATLVWEGLAAALSLEWALVLLVAVVAGIQALRFVQQRRNTSLRATETPDPEQRYTAPTPGDDAEESLSTASGWSRRGRRAKSSLRKRVGDAAIDAIVDATGCREDEAVRRIETGEWTEDPLAAWFLSENVTLSTRQRLRLLVRSPGSQFETGFDRAVAAIERLSEGEPA